MSASKERLYNVWRGMKSRCYTKSDARYEKYGGRGITVCEEWRTNYYAFKKWAYKNGYDENAKRGVCTLDRINVDGNYEPSNCRWTNMKVQSNNKTDNIIWEAFGEKHTISEWADIYNIKYGIIDNRLRRGWSIEDAISTPNLGLTRKREEIDEIRKGVECHENTA